MAFSFWKKMFGAEGENGVCEVPQDEAVAEGHDDNAVEASEPEEACECETPLEGGKGFPVMPGDIGTLEHFVEYVAKNLVDNADAVTVSTEEKERISVIQIRCEKKDIGKIIGKSGKTIAALRLLVSGAGGRMGKRVTVDVLD